MSEGFRPYDERREFSEEDMRTRAPEFYEDIRCRRTVRDFSDRPVPRDIIETCLLAAGTAPNGANSIGVSNNQSMISRA